MFTAEALDKAILACTRECVMLSSPEHSGHEVVQAVRFPGDRLVWWCSCGARVEASVKTMVAMLEAAWFRGPPQELFDAAKSATDAVREELHR